MATLIPLILGLVIFLGGHTLSRLPLKGQLVAKLGPNTYRAIYSLVAIMGFALIITGYGNYRAAGYIPVWSPPKGMAHLSILILWVAMILLAATYLPGLIKNKAKHPMLAAVKAWALAHLLANGDLGSILLFGSFLGWGVYARIALKRAGNMGGVPGGVSGFGRNDIIAIIVGTAVTGAMVFGLHKWLFGVAVLG